MKALQKNSNNSEILKRIDDDSTSELMIRNVNKRFGSTIVANDININVKKSEILALLGPSGCGKTTLLRMIAGLEFPDEGEILIRGNNVSKMSAKERNIGFVFQDYALFPHMNVFENIAYGLRIRKIYNESEITEKIENILSIVELSGSETKKINQLSGGQQQRVALARAMVIEPKVLLMDEPMGALDAKLRKQMQLEFRTIQRKVGITTIFVTHDQEEALTMSDRVAVMNGGQVEQLDIAREVYDKPKTKFVASFIGDANIFEGIINDGKFQIINDELFVTLPSKLATNEKVTAVIRPERISIIDSNAKFDTTDNYLYGLVEKVVFFGDSILYNVEVENFGVLRVRSTIQKEEMKIFKEKDKVGLFIPSNSIRIIQKEEV